MSILYDLIIEPLVVMIDIIFSIIYGMIESPVLSILVFSVCINFIVIPLYKKADEIQREEQNKVEQMKKWTDHIKHSFKGDERYMMLSTYYKIEGYSPVSILKEAVPLFLQTPFFIAAYRYISSLTIFEGMSFGVIKDLLAPDGILKIGGLSINVLPILMTVVNLLSGYIYSEKGPLRLKIQILVTALVFLVLLYDSPSILVIYWLMNNIFSAFKNIFFKNTEKYRNKLQVVISIILIAGVIVLILGKTVDSELDRMVAELVVLFSIISLMKNIILLYLNKSATEKEKKLVNAFVSRIKANSEVKNSSVLKHLFLSGACMTLMMGLYIPSNVISSSPLEFTQSSTNTFQTDLILHPFFVYAGFIIIWLTIMIMTNTKTRRYYVTGVLWAFCGVAILNFLFFNPYAGTLYVDLTTELPIEIETFNLIINALVCLFIGIVFLVIYIKRPRLMEYLAVSLSLGLIIISVSNVAKIYETIEKTTIYKNDEDYPLKLSRNGKNVVVFMLDRAIGEYVPYIFDEKEDLKDKYAGFRFYQNTISFGTHTNYGAPPIFGGYEYIPSEMNKRDDVLLKDKNDEALILMPALFSKNGYNVVVCDPPNAGYSDIPDLSIYNGYSGIKAYNLYGKYSHVFSGKLKGDAHEIQKKNFLMYSLYRIVPSFMKKQIYNGGLYITWDNQSIKYLQSFIASYSMLDSLEDITEIREDDSDNFLMLQNSTPHNPIWLNSPEYDVYDEKIDSDFKYSDKIIDGKTMKINKGSQWKHYCVNVLTYETLAEWLKYLKEQGVYDNTRIILVADHGYYLNQFDYLYYFNNLDVESLRPLLMVKDFNSRDEWTIDMSFMTNADVPLIAMDGLIENPINPFTGNPVTNELKKSGPLLVTISNNWNVKDNNGYVFETGNTWYSVHDNLYDMNNWKKEE
jgi:YidC/Oxa1 family membrane protein insertase